MLVLSLVYLYCVRALQPQGQVMMRHSMGGEQFPAANVSARFILVMAITQSMLFNM